MSKAQSVLLRFFKGFLAGGIASVASFLGVGITIHSALDARHVAFAALSAFLTGGLLAVEKLLTFTDTTTPQQPK